MMAANLQAMQAMYQRLGLTQAASTFVTDQMRLDTLDRWLETPFDDDLIELLTRNGLPLK